MNKKKILDWTVEILLAVASVVWAKYQADKDFEEKAEEFYEKKLLERRGTHETNVIEISKKY